MATGYPNNPPSHLCPDEEKMKMTLRRNLKDKQKREKKKVLHKLINKDFGIGNIKIVFK